VKATSLIRLYPRAWRERYGEEFAELVARQRPGPRMIADILLGADRGGGRLHRGAGGSPGRMCLIIPRGGVTSARKRAGSTLPLCFFIIVSGCAAESRAGSAFLRVTEPGSAIHDLNEIIERTCIVRTVTTRTGNVSFRFPKSCESTMQPAMDAVAKGCDQLAGLFEPLVVHVDSVVAVLDNARLPANVRYKTAHEKQPDRVGTLRLRAR
jgi:hypothetical protein